MSPAAPPIPTNVVAFPNGEIGVTWNDGHESVYSGRALRCACPCAGCVDEMTGKKTLLDETVPADVHAKKITAVGRYAITILWSDTHDTGIFSFENLRRLCPCDACRG